MSRAREVALWVCNNAPILLALIALTVGVLLRPLPLQRPAHNFQVTFDISQSMNVEDMVIDGVPVSRLTFAKAVAFDLLRRLPCGSRIGWSLFTERRAVALITPVEVCQHYSGLLATLDYIDNSMRWAEASGVGKGLYQSIRAAHEIGGATRVIFMTDGHEAPPLRSGARGMPNTDKFDVGGLIVGLGDTVPVRIPKVSRDGRVAGYWRADEVVQRSDNSSGPSREQLSRRQDDHLSTLAQLAGLHYLPLGSPDLLADAALAKSNAHLQVTPVDLRWIPVSIALLLLSWRFRPGSAARLVARAWVILGFVGGRE